MKLRCKPGDLAVIVSAKYLNHLVGKIVTCVRLDGHLVRHWHVSPVTYYKSAEVIFRDDTLRPIRDQPGTDETLQWADKPIDSEVLKDYGVRV